MFMDTNTPRHSYEELEDVELPPEVEVKVNAAVEQAEEDLAAQGRPHGSIRPALVFGALFLTSGGLLNPNLSAWLHIGLALVNLVLLVVLRIIVHDHLLARSLGVDLVIRDVRPPKIRIVRAKVQIADSRE